MTSNIIHQTSEMGVMDTGGGYRHHHTDKNKTTKIRLVPKGIDLFFVFRSHRNHGKHRNSFAWRRKSLGHTDCTDYTDKLRS